MKAPTYVERGDCKFCAYDLEHPTIYDAPELVRSHALHIVDTLSITSPEWDKALTIAGRFIRVSEGAGQAV